VCSSDLLAGAKTDSPAVRYASQANWGKLLKAGVKIYEYQPTMYHCKFMIVDDLWVSVGSANFDNRSFRLNDECNMNVYSPEFAAAQNKVFEEDKSKSRQRTYNDWKHRSMYKRSMEVMTAPFRSLF
jgi:cardiolipin synthase